jgi:hypothetical protein
MSSSEQCVLLHTSAPLAPHPHPHRDRAFRFRVRVDRVLGELGAAGFSLDGLATASIIQPALLKTILAADSGRTSKTNCRRILRGLSILAGRTCREAEFVEDLIAEGAA